MKKELNKLHIYLLWAIIVFLIILSYLIVKPFLISLVSAFILGYLLKPIYFKFSKHMRPALASALCILLTLLVLLIPLGLIIGGVLQQAYSALQDTSVTTILNQFSKIPLLESLNINLELIRQKGIQFFIGLLSNTASFLPELLISGAVTIFSLYYMLIHWNTLSSKLEKYIPFENKKHAVEEISTVTRGIIYGTVLIAVIQSIIAGISFWLIGVPNYLLMTAIIFFFGFIPSIGPAVVWVPFLIYYIMIGSYAQAIGIGIVGLILSVGIDTIFRTKVLGDEAKMSPVLMLVSVLGGLALFGIFGFIIGPLITVYTLKLIEQAIENN